MAENLTAEQWQACDDACRQDNYEGYSEHEFLQAFDRLCVDHGGYQSGLKAAIKLMKEQVQ